MHVFVLDKKTMFDVSRFSYQLMNKHGGWCSAYTISDKWIKKLSDTSYNTIGDYKLYYTATIHDYVHKKDYRLILTKNGFIGIESRRRQKSLTIRSNGITALLRTIVMIDNAYGATIWHKDNLPTQFIQDKDTFLNKIVQTILISQ